MPAKNKGPIKRKPGKYAIFSILQGRMSGVCVMTSTVAEYQKKLADTAHYSLVGTTSSKEKAEKQVLESTLV